MALREFFVLAVSFNFIWNTFAEIAGSTPNVLFILVDDLAWGNVGFHSDFDEVSTPNIDYLRDDGVELWRHYTYFKCCPSRSSFLSGRLPIHVNIDECETGVLSPQSGIPRKMTSIGNKMTTAGFNTYYVGKWDVGVATNDHLPRKRGFVKSLIYMESYEDYFTHEGSTCSKADGYEDDVFYDLWESTLEREGPAYQVADDYSHDYVEYIFRDRVLEYIDHEYSQDADDTPFFMIYAPHIAHYPMQVPEEYYIKYDGDEHACKVYTDYIYPGLAKTDTLSFGCRSAYDAMINLLDNIVGEIVTKLKSNNQYDNTLIIFTSDNGGDMSLQYSGANNHPLRGSKETAWEGGVRTVSFVSGGWDGLPTSVRGTTQKGMIHIADWYTTFCEMFGVESYDYKAAAQGLPEVDGVNVWPLITGLVDTSPRSTYIIDDTAVIDGDYKLIINDDAVPFATWTGKEYPNITSSNNNPEEVTLDCSDGCLFNVATDFTEHIDISSEYPSKVQGLKEMLVEEKKSFYNNDDDLKYSCNLYDDYNDKHISSCLCWMGKNVYDSYFGPFCGPVDEDLDIITNAAKSEFVDVHNKNNYNMNMYYILSILPLIFFAIWKKFKSSSYTKI